MTQHAVHNQQWPADGLEDVSVCPVCGESANRVLYESLVDRAFFCAPGEWTLYQCVSCEAAYLNPRPNQETIGLAYSSYYTHSAAPEVEHVADKGRKRRRIAARNGYINAQYGYNLEPAWGNGRWLTTAARCGAERWIRHLPFGGKDARLLDLGCGNGAFLAQMRVAGWHVTGLDLDERAVQAAQSVGLDVRCGELKESTFPPASFDVITLNHVIEHLPHPVETLSICQRLLRSGGVIWIGTPNLSSRGHEVFGRDWFALDPPRHLVIFTPKSLRIALERAGFDIVNDSLRAWNARSNFLASAAVAAGIDPLDPSKLPAKTLRQTKRESQKANQLALSQPRYSEELLFIARKRDTDVSQQP